MDKAEAEMREILAGEMEREPHPDATLVHHIGSAALRAMAAYGDLRARQERERCLDAAEDATGGVYACEHVVSAIRSLPDKE